MKNLFDLTGKVVAITGGAGNLGTAMTAALLDYGANVAAVGRDDRLGDDFLPWREKGKLAFIARDLAAPKKIRVNALTPGPFPNVTPQTDRSFIERLSGKTMMRRTGRAEEIAGALILLCSDASSFMTGSNIVVDGGMTSW